MTEPDPIDDHATLFQDEGDEYVAYKQPDKNLEQHDPGLPYCDACGGKYCQYAPASSTVEYASYCPEDDSTVEMGRRKNDEETDLERAYRKIREQDEYDCETVVDSPHKHVLMQREITGWHKVQPPQP